ncbi:XRE family transcriptional regulator [Bacteroides thetaiotaomicron]|nr:XRE family transcriptional regulator [Bacteroides thetaiotaomicron]MBL3939804.1 XRE family transcriptional regulator [Bacteroides thetaiotaomicron]
MIHIGKQIRQKMEEHQKTVVWLAKRLSCSRANVYKIFEKYSVDTDMLARISTILNFDFFSLYSEDIKKKNSQE